MKPDQTTTDWSSLIWVQIVVRDLKKTTTADHKVDGLIVNVSENVVSLSSADNLSKQFGRRSGQTKHCA